MINKQNIPIFTQPLCLLLRAGSWQQFCSSHRQQQTADMQQQIESILIHDDD